VSTQVGEPCRVEVECAGAAGSAAAFQGTNGARIEDPRAKKRVVRMTWMANRLAMGMNLVVWLGLLLLGVSPVPAGVGLSVVQD